jgi:hypothetical protein
MADDLAGPFIVLAYIGNYLWLFDIGRGFGEQNLRGAGIVQNGT